MSFTLFNAAKKRRKAEEEFQAERQSLIKEYNKYSEDINEKIDYYKKYVKDNYPEYEYSNGYTSAVLWMGNVKPFVPYGTLLSGDNEKLKDVVEEVKEGVSKVDKIVNEEIEKLDKSIEESKVSVAAFEEFVQKPSMFFVLENIFDGNKLYCFCYEFQVINKDGKRMARALITDNETGNCWIKEINAEEEKIRSMTFEEFEKNFIKERIELQGFSKEEDIVEYDNYLRRLFNNQ
jgi:hypothetical protein